jgi:hypothetical protein
MLAQREPFPAFALDRHWNLLDCNRGGVRLLPANASVNLADALVAPDVLQSQHRNPLRLNPEWATVAPRRQGHLGYAGPSR